MQRIFSVFGPRHRWTGSCPSQQRSRTAIPRELFLPASFRPSVQTRCRACGSATTCAGVATRERLDLRLVELMPPLAAICPPATAARTTADRPSRALDRLPETRQHILVHALGPVARESALQPHDPVAGKGLSVGANINSRRFPYPTATSDILGAHRWGAGPTAVALKQQGPWTYGVLANHIWSFAETSTLGPDVNSTFIQPFIGYTTSTAFTTTINTESTYNWLSHRWIIPINLLFSQVVTIAGQPISLQAGPRYYATTTDQGGRWGVRFNITLLFPAK